MSNEELIRLAFEAREKAYAPYSNWKVGAALLTESGKVYLGCNIENSGFTATVCAERTAFFKAISEGIYDFSKIAGVLILLIYDWYTPLRFVTIDDYFWQFRIF